jgi:hypothetical protein
LDELPGLARATLTLASLSVLPSRVCGPGSGGKKLGAVLVREAQSGAGSDRVLYLSPDDGRCAYLQPLREVAERGTWRRLRQAAMLGVRRPFQSINPSPGPAQRLQIEVEI